MSERIIFNGRVYNHVSEMAPDVRQFYEHLEAILRDENLDGVPDFVQQGGLKGFKEAFGMIKELSNMTQSNNSFRAENVTIIKETDTSITVNGKTFRSVTDMPKDVQKIYHKAVSDADPASIEIYDEPWRERDRDSYFTPHDDEVIEAAYRMPESSSVFQPVNSNVGLILAVVVAIFLCAGAGIFYFLTSGEFF